MEPVCIEYEVTEKDYVDFMEYDLKKMQKGRLLPYSILFAVLMFLFSIVQSEDDYIFIAIAFVLSTGGGALFYGAMGFTRRWQAAYNVKSVLRRGQMELQFFGRHCLELREDDIEQRYGTVCTQCAYAVIHKVEDYGNGIVIRYSQTNVDFIPSTAFGDARQRGDFLNLLQTKVSQAKYADISSQNVDEQSAIYKLEYTWDEESLINAMVRANRLMYTTRLGWSAGRIISTITGIFLCFIGIVSFIGTITAVYEFDGVFAVFSEILCVWIGFYCLSTLLITFTPWARKQYRRQIDGGVISRDYSSPQALCFKEDKMTELRRLTSADYAYDKVYCVKHDENGMYIFLKIKRFLVIPNSAFRSDDQKREIAAYIETKTQWKSR